MAIEVRLATRDDAEAIRTIYNREVSGSTVTFDLVPRSLEDQRRQLVDRRLARSGRQHGQRVPPRQHGIDRLGLAGPQVVEPERVTRDATDLREGGGHRPDRYPY